MTTHLVDGNFRKTFETDNEEYRKYNGMSFRVLEEIDDHIGSYLIEVETGERFEAWPEEVEEEDF